MIPAGGYSVRRNTCSILAIISSRRFTGMRINCKYIISAALIIADKTDVRRNRVRNKAKENFDIHDRVNYAVTDAALKINMDKKVIALNLQIDTKICSMYEYFEIFLGRMMMCRGAAEVLGATFKLTANGSKVL